MSFLCLLVFFVCVLHNSSLTLDVFFTEHGCNHWVGWGEFLLSKFSATAICQASFCFLLPSLNTLWLLPGFDFDVTFSEFLKLFLSYMYSLSFNWFHNTLLWSHTLYYVYWPLRPANSPLILFVDACTHGGIGTIASPYYS